MSAIEYYELHIQGQARPKENDVTRGQNIVDCFKAVATPPERVLLKASSNPAVPEVANLLLTLHDRFVGRLLKAWADLKQSDPPAMLKKFEPLKANAVTDRISALAKLYKKSFAAMKLQFEKPISPEEISKLPQRPESSHKKKSAKRPRTDHVLSI
eukprot:TRINITY_DN18189_c0_g1_i1.p1 TRINITY_DN18189_c0_g1~~TRINITY_DN18189_c0_g1_i1.p1  ORF type:complete len:156 (-),score=16.24 TRINITY_DN18189_c0_g1_i1:123-590(-)